MTPQTQPGIDSTHHCVGCDLLNSHAVHVTPDPKRADRAKAERMHFDMRSNGEVEGPHRSAHQAPRAHNLSAPEAPSRRRITDPSDDC
jgi:hypothetical protein